MVEPKVNELMEKLVSLCKRRGFVFPSSDVYGGINGFWDYGPLGAELKRNVKDLWWRSMVQFRDDVVGLEATIIMHPQIWKASGHVDTFSDPMSTCRHCQRLVRSDQAQELSSETVWYQVLDSIFQENKGSTDASRAIASIRERMKEIRKSTSALALVKQTDAVLERLSLSCREGLPGPLPSKPSAEELLRYNPLSDFRLFVRHLGTQNLRETGLVYFPCPHCGGEITEPRQFNLMFKTYVGPVADEDNVAYLRPETAQAIFVQFKNVLETSRQKVPFGIAQMGKAFRNEVTPRNFTFRSREFEQMELEFFIQPDEVVSALRGSVAPVGGAGHPGEPQSNWGWQLWHKYWVEERIRFYESIGLPRTTLEEYWQKPDELAHYARATVDLLFKFPFGTQELEGIAARSDFDLSQHARCSGKSMGVFDEDLRTQWGKLDDATKKSLSESYFAARHQYLLRAGVAPEEAHKLAREDADGLAKGQFIPHVIEPSAGTDRLILALLCHAYSEVTTTDDKGKSETRVIMRFHPKIAPIKVGVFPLLKNKPELVAKAREIFQSLRVQMPAFYDEAGAIGRRYARQDEAGTPYCVTVDFDTLGEKPELLNTVTLRHRDTGAQERVAIADLASRLLPLVR